MLAAYRALRNYARACRGDLSDGAAPAAGQPVLPRAVGARRRGAPAPTLAAARSGARRRSASMHVGGPAGTRGAFSLYVPETYDPSRAWPLVVAMHGGSGNGGAFLWSWLREARTRGFIVLAPTASGSTWSLMEPDVDGANIDRMVDEVAERSGTSMPARQLLTGMSDGGTFSYVLGLRERLPLHPSRAGRGGLPSADDDDLRRRRPRARPADPHRARRRRTGCSRRSSRASAEQTLGAGRRRGRSTARSPTSRTPIRATRTARSSIGSWRRERGPPARSSIMMRVGGPTLPLDGSRPFVSLGKAGVTQTGADGQHAPVVSRSFIAGTALKPCTTASLCMTITGS